MGAFGPASYLILRELIFLVMAATLFLVLAAFPSAAAFVSSPAHRAAAFAPKISLSSRTAHTVALRRPASPGSVSMVEEAGPAAALSGAWEKYESSLESNPILTKAATSLVGFALGDIIAQTLIDGTALAAVDSMRVLKLASFGFLLHGTTGHFFYNFLDNKIPGTGAKEVASKVFIDQVLWNPIFGICFFGYLGLFEGLSLAETGLKIQDGLFVAVTGSWKFWPIAHAVNFRFIPTRNRLLYINTLQIFYNVFLSIIASTAASS